MNRLKFRAWNPYDKEMIHYSLDELIESVWSENPKNNLVRLSRLWETDRTEKQQMRSTGLLDMNGIEIFEGDIVDINDNGQTGWGVVLWQENKWFVNDTPINELTDFEIFGNIYENPEMIK